MKISLNWVKQFTEVDLSIDELVAKIGAQLGAVEEVINVGAKYQGIVVAKVVSCEKHPNADKLSLCMVDDGGIANDVERNNEGYVQVVCGAPNVAESMLVAWIPPGATVPCTFDSEPFVLDARELRGKVSNGMIASAKELAIGDAHEGILEIDVEAAPGTPFAELYDLNDYVIDIENKMFTHRPDCFGILGVAREIAGICDKQFKSPDWYLKPLDRVKPGKTKLPLQVKNQAPDDVPRFMAVAMADVTIKPSPLVIQSYLSRVGIKPINNVVDTTNYLMHLTGQPTHAYDYDKLKELSNGDPVLVARQAGANEKAELLNGKTYKINKPSVVIATDKTIVGVGGIMGSKNSEVDENTKNIVLECANFNMYSIRRTSMKHGLFTDAVTRFNKGQSMLQNDIILEEAVATLQYVCGAHVASDVFDEGPNLPEQQIVEADYHFINDRLGLDLDKQDIKSRLENVELSVTIAEKDILQVTPPYWRTDIEIAVDLVEEVGRLIGFDQLPHGLPQRSVQPVKLTGMIALQQLIRTNLAALGANEVLGYNFVHGDLLEVFGQDKDQAFKLNNALSPDLQYFRMSLLPGLLEKVPQNIRSDYVTTSRNSFALFEIGKSHVKGVHDAVEAAVPHEFQQLAIVVAADEKAAKNNEGAPYYFAATYVHEFAEKLHINVQFQSFDQSLLDGPAMQRYAGFELNRSAFVMHNNQVIGIVGEFTGRVRRKLKLPNFVAGSLLDLDAISEITNQSDYKQMSKFPKTTQDITLRVKSSIGFAEVQESIIAVLQNLNDNHTYLLQPLSIFSNEISTKNISFRLWLGHYQKSMTTEEANAIVASIAKAANEQCEAEQV